MEIDELHAFGGHRVETGRANVGGTEAAKILVALIIGEKNDNVYLSSRNLRKVKVVTADSVNTYDVLNAGKVVMAASSIEAIEKILN